MSQNTSHAVMAQRTEPHDSLDDFPTQPWATRALVEHVLFPHLNVFGPAEYLKTQTAWEPACNRGHMALPLREYFQSVHASDIHDYSPEWSGQERLCDSRAVNIAGHAYRNMPEIEAQLLRFCSINDRDLSGAILVSAVAELERYGCPGYAITSQAVNLARESCGETVGKFVNAVLRRIVADREQRVDTAGSVAA